MNEGGHWYTPDGEPMHFVQRASGDGTRPTTLADARKLGLLPSVTTILKAIAKPGLENWIAEQKILACLTTPRKDGEDLDAFVHRVLHVEHVDRQESQKAMDLGTAIHEGIELSLTGLPYDLNLTPFVAPAVAAALEFGRIICTERVVVGDGYAGKLDCAAENGITTVIDFKTCKKVPKESWNEHRLQLAAYCKAFGTTGEEGRMQNANIYVSTVEPGKVAVCVNDGWDIDYALGFSHILALWRYMNDYYSFQAVTNEVQRRREAKLGIDF